ncbi:alpha/beta hydrolase [Streptomyces siamensis]|uniref:Alpha/beta hydrolase n=1 Tax=Streptomyces siamensis TaxID=1274986 RepID=A0ABP9J752_9ACTN
MSDHVLTSEEPPCEAVEKVTCLPPSVGRAPGTGVGGPGSGNRTQADVEERWAAIFGGPQGSVAVHMVRPKQACGPLPTVLYLHGGNGETDSRGGHDRLIRELAVGAQAAVLYPEYTLTPNTSYRTALEECCTVARWITEHGSGHGMDPTRLAVVGHFAGGNMSAALTLMATERAVATFALQVLLYPLPHRSAAASTPPSGKRDITSRFRDHHTTDTHQDVEAGDVLETSGQRLTGLPPALVVTAETDVLQDAGQTYAAKLRSAGVAVSTVHYDRAVRAPAPPSARAPHAAITHVISALKQAFADGR